MRGKAFRQVVRGRVIRPATRRDTKNGNQFLTFQLAVDGLDSSEPNKTGYIGCAYFPPSGKSLEEDVVAQALGWITTDENNPTYVTSDGFYYKSVEVTVEGQLSLSSFKVKDEQGNDRHSGAYYVNLQFCNIDIHRRQIVDAVKACLGITNQQQTTTQGQLQVQQPTTAPTPATPQPVAAAPAPTPPVAAAAAAPAPTPTEQTTVSQGETPKEGDLIQTESGDLYKFTGGQYKFFGKANTTTSAPTPVQQTPGVATTPTQQTGPSNLGEVLNTPASANPSADLAAQRSTGGQQVG